MREGRDRGIAIGRMFCQGAENDSINVRRNASIERTGGLRLPHQVLVHDLFLGAKKRGTPGQQFVSHNRKRILVGRGYWIGTPLFGGHVGRRPANGFAHVNIALHEARNAEVCQQQIRAAWRILPAAHEKIRGFDIAMNDPLVVGVLERIGGLPHNM